MPHMMRQSALYSTPWGGYADADTLQLVYKTAAWTCGSEVERPYSTR